MLDDKLLIDGKLYDSETGEFLRNLVPASETRELAAGPAVSQDGSRLAWITKDGELTVWDGAGNRALWTEKYVPPGNNRRSVSMSADGGRLAGHVNTQGFVWNVDSHQQALDFQSNNAYWSRLSPSGRQLLVTNRDGWQSWHDASSELITEKRGIGGGQVQFTPDGALALLSKQVQHGNADHEFIALDMKQGKERLTLPTRGFSAALSPDGRHVISAATGKLQVTSLAAPSSTRQLLPVDLGIDALELSSDGRMVVGCNYQTARSVVYRLLPISSADREAAEALLPYANLDVVVEGKPIQVPIGRPLPSQPFALRGIEMHGYGPPLPPRFVDEIFLPLVGQVQSLSHIYDFANRLNDALSDPQRLRKLAASQVGESLTVLFASIGSSSDRIKALAAFPRLRGVYLNANIPDLSALQSLAPNIDSVTLGYFGENSSLTIANMDAVASLRMKRLSFRSTRSESICRLLESLGEKGQIDTLALEHVFTEHFDRLQPLAANKTLKCVALAKSISDADAQRVAAMLPKCRIDYGGKCILPKIEKQLAAEGETVDLLPLIDLSKHVRNGVWRKEQAAIVSPTERNAAIELPIVPAAAYRLNIAAERIMGDQDVFFGLPVGGSEVRLHLEGFKDAQTGLKRSGLALIEHKDLKQAAYYPNPIFSTGKPVQIVIEVSPGRVWATCDGQAVANWEGDPQRLSVGELAQRTKTIPKSLFVATYESSYRISELKYTPLAVGSGTTSP